MGRFFSSLLVDDPALLRDGGLQAREHGARDQKPA